MSLGGRSLVLLERRWCRGRGPQPPAAVQRVMIESLGGQLSLSGGGKPFGLLMRSWPRPPDVDPAAGDFLAEIMIEADPSLRRTQTLKSFVQWQHPVWSWSRTAFPEAAKQGARA